MSTSGHTYSSFAASPRLMGDIEGALPVRLIATPRADLQTCRGDQSIAELLDRDHRDFDYLPVIENLGRADERIVGLLEIAEAASSGVSGNVSAAMRALSEDNLIGADASILTFLR